MPIFRQKIKKHAGLAATRLSVFGYVFLWTSVTVVMTVMAMESETVEGSSAAIATVLADLHSASEADFPKYLQNVKNQRQENFLRLYVAEIPKLPLSRQPMAIRLLKERDDLEFLPSTILRLAKNGNDEVRMAAVELMELHGHGGCVPVLLEILAVTEAGQTKLRETATRTLNSLKGEEINDAIVWELRSTNSQIQRLAMQQIQARPIRTSEAEDELWAIVTVNIATNHNVTNHNTTNNNVTEEDTVSVRRLAVTTLGHIAATESLTRMTKELDVSVRRAANHPTAPPNIPAIDWTAAMETVAKRAADQTVAARKMLIGLDGTLLDTQCNVLRVIGKLKGPYPQSVLEAASFDDREPIRAVAVFLLAQRHNERR